jgi:predicted O-methyltransferase YrrM
MISEAIEMTWEKIRKLLHLFRLAFVRPTWAWSYVWFSSNNPLNFRWKNVERIKEYDHFQLPLPELLQKYTRANSGQVTQMLDEFNEIRMKAVSADCSIPTYCDASYELGCLCYCVVRLARPATVIETGVGRGVTSYYILSALEKNRLGSLISIDLPALKARSQKDIGTLVPTSLRSRWNLILGPGPAVMRKLCKTVGRIDLFIHDSNHSYLNQIMEYELALNWLRAGGILISDDVHNNALLEARERYGGQLAVTNQGKPSYLGIITKQLQPGPVLSSG